MIELFFSYSELDLHFTMRPSVRNQYVTNLFFKIRVFQQDSLSKHLVEGIGRPLLMALYHFDAYCCNFFAFTLQCCLISMTLLLRWTICVVVR